jgi:hypothetical protein
MKKFFLLFFTLILWAGFNGEVWGQVTVFEDNFSTNTSATYTTSGAIGSSDWSVFRSGADWGARRNTSPEQLELTNDVDATPNVNGWVFAATSTSSFDLPYNTTLNLNTGVVTWTFNLRTNRANLAGFGAGSYGLAFIIGANGNDVSASSVNDGYALVLGNSSTPDPLKFGYFTDGLDGFNALITSNTSGLTNIGTNYYSVKITYNPSTDTWEFFLRDDGSSNFADPTGGTLTSQGTAINNTYSDIVLSSLGGHWQGSTGATQTAFFDNVKVTVVDAASPSITVAPSTLTSFSYVDGSGPSSEQSFTISGTNLTDDISITPSTNYEISTGTGVDFSATNPITLTETGGTVDETTIYVRLKSGLSSGNYNDEEITATSSGATDKTVTCSGTVYKIEPTNHATAFISAAGTPDYSAINLSWTDATGGTVPDGYLIKGSNVGYGSIADPVDGTAESDAALIKNIAHGVQTATISGLTASTTYYFKIFPYTNSATNINYKIDGVVPTTTLGTGSAPAASLLLEENFDFSGALTSNGWTAHSGGGTNAISTTSGLSYTDYPSSAIGNAATITATGEDDNRTFTQQTSGSIYTSFMVNVSSATTTGDYFFHLSTNPIGSFYGRVFAKDDGEGNLKFGIAKSSAASYATGNYSYNSTYLLVVKYTFNGASADDVVGLYINPSLGGSEPISFDAQGTTSEADIAGLGLVALRQSTTTPVLVIDGIRVSDGWSESPLPVELSSFNAAATNGAVKLTWQTATEVNNYGFQVERKMDKVETIWEEIGFVAGSGNSNAPKDYSYTDNSLDNSGKYSYRLKQIDNDGKTTYSNEIETDVTVVLEYALSQNYPNPFNPSTVINYTLSQPGFVTIKIYNTLGQEVSTLLNGQMDAGKHTLTFDASKLSSGMYLYKITAGNFTQVKKMLLAK